MAELNFPLSPELGDLPTEMSNGVSYVWDGTKWSQAGGSAGGGSSNINTGEYPPSAPTAGDLWFDEVQGILFVYYVDSDGTKQWVDARPANDGGGSITDIDIPSYPALPNP